MTITEMWTQLGSVIAGLMFGWAMFKQYFPDQLRGSFNRYTQRLVGFVYPYLQITFHEYTGERLKRSEVYSAIQSYLSANSSMLKFKIILCSLGINFGGLYIASLQLCVGRYRKIIFVILFLDFL
uniref:AAA-type ATPase N-terminal domain-containing protein n=1 Tax=Manihot esculenta TaxID=3983 RepID=A0A2C9UYX1_MANES